MHSINSTKPLAATAIINVVLLSDSESVPCEASNAVDTEDAAAAPVVDTRVPLVEVVVVAVVETFTVDAGNAVDVAAVVITDEEEEEEEEAEEEEEEDDVAVDVVATAVLMVEIAAVVAVVVAVVAAAAPVVMVE